MIRPRATGETHVSDQDKDRAIAVTGGRGFLGGFVTAELAARGYTDVAPLGSRDFDLVDPHACERFFGERRPDTVIHLAAAVGGIGANKDNPGLFSYANTLMGANVFECARKFGASKVVTIGTICVYPANAPVPTPESAMFDGFPAQDTAPYGLAKRNVWMMGTAYRRQYGLNAVFLIPTNLYGPRDHFDEARSHVIPALIRRFIEAREKGLSEVVIWGDGSATREFLYAADAARGIVDAMERYDSTEPVNLGTGREISIKALAEEIKLQTRYDGRLVWDTDKPTGAPRRSLAVERARQAFGFRAEMAFDEGLRRTIEWYESEGRKD